MNNHPIIEDFIKDINNNLNLNKTHIDNNTIEFINKIIIDPYTITTKSYFDTNTIFIDILYTLEDSTSYIEDYHEPSSSNELYGFWYKRFYTINGLHEIYDVQFSKRIASSNREIFTMNKIDLDNQQVKNYIIKNNCYLKDNPNFVKDYYLL